MAKRKTEEISRRNFIGVSIGAAVAAGIGCASDDKSQQQGTTEQGGTSGTSASGGASTANGGQNTANGGANTSTGSTSPSTGGNATGGTTTNVGGSTTSGTSTGVGGASTGGATGSKGGANAGGATGTTRTSAAAGGQGNGGTNASGASSGGKSGTTVTGGSPATGGAGGSSSGSTGLVALVRGTDWVQATIDAITMAGGLPDLSGKTVLLKPNIISSSANATTSKDVILGVIKAVKAKNATKIIVAESGWGSGKDVMASMSSLGIAKICTDEGVTAMDLAKAAHTTRSGVDFSDDVYNAGYVINIPVAKSHGMAKFTMALKNWYGCTENGRSHGNTWDAPGKLHQIKQEGFVVLDATKTMIDGGPDAGTMVQSKIVVASKDAIALDVTGLCIHKYSGGTVISAKGDAWKIHQIKTAMALGLPGWLSSPQAFTYVQQGVTEHAEIMALVGP
ncbi:MAG TPA: DUF362 domain-containing protein [Polyangiaceae bacterium]